MARRDGPRLLEERAIEDGVISGRPLPPRTDGKRAGRGRAQPGGPVRSVTVNLGESPLGWPVRAGKLVLTLALDRVADHYRMPLPSDRPAPVGQATA